MKLTKINGTEDIICLTHIIHLLMTVQTVISNSYMLYFLLFSDNVSKGGILVE